MIPFREILQVDPTCADALQRLSMLLGTAERWEELVAVIAKRLTTIEAGDSAEDGDALEVELGEMRRVHLGDALGGVECFARVLGRDGDHAGAIAALERVAREGSGPLDRAKAAMLLEPIYRAANDHLRLAGALMLRAEVATGSERAVFESEAARLHGADLASPEMAFISATLALGENPDDEKALEIALVSSETTGGAGELASLLKGLLDRASGPDSARRIRRALASLYRSRLGNLEGAADQWRKILEVSPDDRMAFLELEELLRQLGDHSGILELARRQLAISDDLTERRELFRKMGRIQEEVQRDDDAALASYRRLLELVPNDRDALRHLDGLFERSERWPELATLLDQEARYAGEDGDAQGCANFLCRLGKLREGPLNDVAAAIETYRAALGVASGHPETVERLDALLQRFPRLAAAAELLQEVHRTSGDHQRFAATLEARATIAVDPETRKALWVELAQVRAELLDRPDLAFLAFCRAFDEDPADVHVRRALESSAEVAETEEELAAVYEEAVARSSQQGVRGPLLIKLGELYERKLGDPERALTHLERALEVDPDGGKAALPALERLYRKAERWDRLADILAELAALVPETQEKVALLYRLGQLAEERLSAPDRAANAYEELLSVAPAHLPTLRAIERLYEAAGRWPELYEVLNRQRAVSPEGPAHDRLTARAAEVAASRLGNDSLAADLWSDLLSKSPRSEDGLIGLEAALDRLGRWLDLAELLRSRLKLTVDPREITRLTERLGWVQGTHLGQAAEATKSFRSVLERDPRNRKALEALRALHMGQGEWDDLASVLRRLIPLQEDAEGVKAVRLQLAETLLSLGRGDEAVEATRRAMDLEPHSMADLDRAEALFRALSAWPECLRVMDARADLLAPDRPAEALELWFSIADLQARMLQRPDLGTTMLEKVLDRDPTNGRAAIALRDLYSRAGDWQRFAVLLDKLHRHEEDPRRAVALLCELAAVQEQRFGQKDMAFLSLCRALNTLPGVEGLDQAVRRLAQETGAVEELTAVYESLADSLDPQMACEAIFVPLARIQDEDLADPDGAESSLRRWLVLDPTSRPAVDQLAELFRRRGRIQELTLTLEQKVNVARTIEEKKSALLELAESYDALGDPGEAVVSLQRGLELDPGALVLSARLEGLYSREKAWPDLIALLQRERELAPDNIARCQVQIRIAEISEKELGDDEAAIVANVEALGFDPKSTVALAALGRLYAKLERPADLVRVYEWEAELAEPKARAASLLKAARIWEERLSDPVKAIVCLESVAGLAELPDEAVLRALERLYRVQGDAERLAFTLERQLQATTELASIVSVEIALAKVWAADPTRADRVEELLADAVRIDPDSQLALQCLSELHERAGRWPEALEFVRRSARAAAAPKQASALFFHAGELLAERMQDPSAARVEFEHCLELEPTHLPALRALKGIFEAAEDWDSYLDIFRREAEAVAVPAEKTRLFHALGSFYRERREDRVAAERCFVEALRWTPNHLPSAKPLADIYLGREDWPRAEVMLDLLVAGEADVGGEPPDLFQQLYRLGYVAEKLQRSEKALDAYRRAHELDPTYLPALEGLGQLLVRTGQLEDALRIFEAILVHHRDDLTELEVVETHWQVGALCRQLSQTERSQKAFEKALEIDPSHEPSRQALVEILEETGQFEAAVENRHRLTELVEGEARFAMCVGLARLAREKLGDPYQAIDGYLQALRVRSDAPEILEKLYELYCETKQSLKAAEALERMLALASVRGDAAVARRVHFQLAQLYRDEIKDDSAAIKNLNLALDADPTFVEAFGVLESLLHGRRDWSGLEQSYHAMIRRLPKTPETHQARMVLWRSLGELYRLALKNPEGAMVAYEVVARGEPSDPHALELLADLYTAKPGQETKAILAHRGALRGTSQPGKSVKALARLHAARKEYDEAFVTAQVAVHLLGERAQEEDRIVERLRRYARDLAIRPMTDQLWSSHLYHERLRGPMAEVLGICHEATGGAFAVDYSRLGVNPKQDGVEVGQSMLFFVNMFKYVAKTLGCDASELFKISGLNGLTLGNSWPVCFLAGEDMFKDRPKKELWFLIAKVMAFSRPELALARLQPAEDLEAIFQAALAIAVPDYQPTAEPREFDRQGRRLEKSLSEAARPALFRAAKECLADPAQLDLRGYVEAVEQTANRAGILLCADVEVAKRCLSRDPGVAARLPERTKVRDLLLFCLSEDFFILRRALGLAIEIPNEGRAAS